MGIVGYGNKLCTDSIELNMLNRLEEQFVGELTKHWI